MTPGARIQTAIDLLELILTPPAGREEVPADALLSGYFRGRRYIGSKDRRAVSELVYTVLRRRAEIDWLADQAPQPARRRVLAALRLQDWGPEDFEAAFDGGQYRPAPLDDAEKRLISEPRKTAGHPTGQSPGQPPEQPPLSVQANVPDWLAAHYADGLPSGAGFSLEAEIGGLVTPAPVDLRVNTLKGDRAVALAALAGAEIDATPTDISPWGVRLAGRTPLGNLPAYREGLLEVQEEGSQLCALLTGAAPGEEVLDFCAGAGGKTLALAAMMQNRGRLLATNTDGGRLAALAKRATRAGATMIESRKIAADESADLGAFDRVMVDAPCSGSGAWRRHPEAPWRLTEARFDGYIRAQTEIVSRAAGYVRPGGWLIYITCSVFPQENQQQIERFVRDHPDFSQADAAEIWRAALDRPPPGEPTVGFRGPEHPGLLLTPHRCGTDGFFLALLRRAD